MKKQGTVVKWDDARGFGFIRSAGTGGDVFVHVKDFRGTPRVGMAVTFEEIHVGGKGPRAMAVQSAQEAPAPRGDTRSRPSPRVRTQRQNDAPGSGAAVALPLMLAYGALLGWAVWTKQFPWWVLPGSLFLNLLAFFAYWQDKYAASQGAWRISEDTLHLWSLAGGWPGAWIAQQVLRHKSRKQPFRSVFWVTVVLHCAAVGGWLFYRR